MNGVDPYENGQSGVVPVARLKRLPSSLLHTAEVQQDRRHSPRSDEEDRRQTLRVEVSGKVKLGKSIMQLVEGQIYNLSATGCSIRLASGHFQVCDEVWFKIDAIQPWKGTIRWVSGGCVGVEFDHPFYQSVFELIAQKLKPCETT